MSINYPPPFCALKAWRINPQKSITFAQGKRTLAGPVDKANATASYKRMY